MEVILNRIATFYSIPYINVGVRLPFTFFPASGSYRLGLQTLRRELQILNSLSMPLNEGLIP